MPKEDVITLEDILDDGTAVVTTDDLAGPNPLAADNLIKAFISALGGEMRRQKRPHAHKKSHNKTTVHH